MLQICMETKPPSSEKFDYVLMQSLGLATLLLGIALLGWAVLTLLMQGAGWIRFGNWQPVPLSSLFITPEGQDIMRFFEGRLQPLNLVPALGSQPYEAKAAEHLAGSLLGLRQVFAWLLDTPLTAWLLFGGIGAMSASQPISEARL
jgi:hypothetical protein